MCGDKEDIEYNYMYEGNGYQEGVKGEGKCGPNSEIMAININWLNFSVKTQ